MTAAARSGSASPRRGSTVGALLLLFVLPLRSSAAPVKEGVEALCAAVATAARPSLSGAKAVSLDLSAEGAALELSDAAAGRCAALLGAASQALSPAADRTVRVRLRVAGTVLAATVDVLGPLTSGKSPAVLLSTAVEAPLGKVLATWLSGAGGGLETWLLGAVDGEVLALCGDDVKGDGAPEVALVTADTLVVLRWSLSGLTPLAQAPLPAALRARARTPGATASCRAEKGALVVAFGIHDRNRGAVVSVKNGVVGRFHLVDGIPLAPPDRGAAPVAQGVAGTDLLRYENRDLAAIAYVPGATNAPARWAAVTEDGATVGGGATGEPMRAGDGVALVDLNRDGVPELVRTLPLWPGSARSDRLVVSPLGKAPGGQVESAPIHGVLGAIGTVTGAGFARVVAVQFDGVRSRLFAFGQRLPPETR